jgi:hypothetical protein
MRFAEVNAATYSRLERKPLQLGRSVRAQTNAPAEKK